MRSRSVRDGIYDAERGSHSLSANRLILDAANLEMLGTRLGTLSVRRLSGWLGLKWNFEP